MVTPFALRILKVPAAQVAGPYRCAACGFGETSYSSFYSGSHDGINISVGKLKSFVLLYCNKNLIYIYVYDKFLRMIKNDHVFDCSFPFNCLSAAALNFALLFTAVNDKDGDLKPQTLFYVL